MRISTTKPNHLIGPVSPAHRLPVLLVGLGVLGASLSASQASAQTLPNIQLTQFGLEILRLERDEIEVDDPAPLRFQWTLQGGDPGKSYSYEIVYGGPSTQTVTSTLVALTADDTNPRLTGDNPINIGQVVFFSMTPAQILKPVLDDIENIERGATELTQNITVHVFEPGGRSVENRHDADSWQFTYDLSPPFTPTLTSVSPRESGLLVEWDQPSDDRDVQFYEVLYCPEGTTADTATIATGIPITGGLPCANPEVAERTGRTVFSAVIKDLTNGVLFPVAVQAIDEFENVSDRSNVLGQAPRPVTDFFEHYKAAGGAEQGGFCFVATAAYGDYGHPMVKVLRWFRDGVLKKTPVGAALVWAYYQASPSAASEIARQPNLRFAAKLALIPYILIALLVLGLPLLGLGAIGFLVFKRFRGATVAATLFLALGLSSSAEAKRPDPALPVGLGLEFRGGPYKPDMSNSPQVPAAANQTSFEAVFKNDGLKPLFSLALDLQIYRGFGSAGVGASFGFAQYVGQARRQGTEIPAGETTVFNILPLTLTGFYRFDWLADRSPIPLVPYVRGGLAYYAWWVTQGTGQVSRFDNGTPDDASDDINGRGGKWGVTGSLGIAFMLNVLEPQAAQSLFNSTNVRGTYIFAEITGAKVDGFGGDGFDLSDATWNLGFYMEI